MVAPRLLLYRMQEAMAQHSVRSVNHSNPFLLVATVLCRMPNCIAAPIFRFLKGQLILKSWLKLHRLSGCPRLHSLIAMVCTALYVLPKQHAQWGCPPFLVSNLIVTTAETSCCWHVVHPGTHAWHAPSVKGSWQAAKALLFFHSTRWAQRCAIIVWFSLAVATVRLCLH